MKKAIPDLPVVGSRLVEVPAEEVAAEQEAAPERWRGRIAALELAVRTLCQAMRWSSGSADVQRLVKEAEALVREHGHD